MGAVSAERSAWLREQTVLLTLDGWTANAIAEKLGITERSVQRYRERTGVSQKVPPPMSPEELEKARLLLDDGCSYSEVGRTLGRAASTIGHHFPNRGWTREQTYEHVGFLRRLRKRLDKGGKQ